MSDITITVAVIRDHDKGAAVLVSDTGREDNAVWIARSLIRTLRPTGKFTVGERKDGQRDTFPLAELTLPEWKAIDAGLA